MDNKLMKMIVQLILFYWIGRQPSDDVDVFISQWVKGNRIDVSSNKYK